MSFYDYPEVLKLVEPYFEENITKYIGETKREYVRKELIALIQVDTSISHKQKAVFRKLANGGSFNRFLSEVCIYAIKQDVPVKLPDSPSEPANYYLTPHAPRVDNFHILGRDSDVKKLCSALKKGGQRIQLTGMGGIGKTEILYKTYAYFANNPAEHRYDHVGLFTYDGSMGANLLRQIDCPQSKSTDTIWEYLRNLCDQASVLLFIDDVRSKHEELPDESFDKLSTLNATILLASRALFDGFQNRTVEPLPTSECIRIFQAQRFIGVNIPLSLPEKDRAPLTNTIENLAGCNALIVNRLGAMTRIHGWSIKELTDSLQKKNFDIRKALESDEKLQEEINKLYTWDNIEDSAERNLLEAFALFRAAPLDMETCTQWLPEDAGIDDEDICRLKISKLAMYTWLTAYIGEDRVSFSMHQLVRAAVKAQVNIDRKNHCCLLERSWGHISLEVQTDGASDWSKAIKVASGGLIHYRVEFKNTGKIEMKNVLIRNILPPGMTYVEGSTKVYNISHREGVTVSDNIVSNTGINIGSYMPGANSWIYFSAVAASADGYDYNGKILRDTIQADGGHITKEDYADIAVEVPSHS